MPTQNNQLANVLEQVGTLIELEEDNPFRARAYHNAARTIQNLDADIAELERTGEIERISGIGKELRGHISEWLSTGKMTLYDNLVAAIEPGLITMLQIDGLGPKRIRTLHDQLGVKTIDELAAACKDGRVASLPGFGAKSQEKILKGIEFLAQHASSFRYDVAESAGETIVARLKAIKGVVRASVAGSLRRRKELVHDIDAVASVADEDARRAIMNAFLASPEAVQIINDGDTKSTIMLADGLKMDLRVVADDEYASALHHFTGSKEHSIVLRGRALDMGIKINEYGLWRGDQRLPIATEQDVYATIGMPYIEPELREDRGEIQAAIEGTLPQLVTEQDFKGALHCHSTWSDGHASIRQMAETCRQMGYTYLGMCDHSQAAAYANGLSPARVRQQHEEIDALNAEYGDAFHILKGTECDILKDGSLDFDDATLATFDFVVASIHQFGKEDQTERLIRAIQNPYVTIIGHLTGRLLAQREGYPVDIPAVIAAAGRRGVAIELNANPARFDLDWRWHRMATEHGVPVPINTDAHTTEGLSDIHYGTGIARKGWLGPQQIPNAWPLPKLLKWFQDVREKGLALQKQV
jgi:DNA polymerase (family X)